jgi:hypothetical protein
MKPESSSSLRTVYTLCLVRIDIDVITNTVLCQSLAIRRSVKYNAL